MKKTLGLLALIASMSSFAQDAVVLNAREMKIDSDKAMIVRTNQSPKKVELKFLVPMSESVCVRHETRMVLRTSGHECGYDYFERRISAGSICVRTNPHNGDCLRFEETYRIERHQRARTCHVPESFCAEYGTATRYERDSMTIEFKDLPALADSEKETFSVVAEQKDYDGINVVYKVSPIETLRPYRVKQKKFLGIKRDAYVVEEK